MEQENHNNVEGEDMFKELKDLINNKFAAGNLIIFIPNNCMLFINVPNCRVQGLT